MLKEVNLAALEAEYTAKLAPRAVVAPGVLQEAVVEVAPVAKPRKAASKKKVPALLKADASAKPAPAVKKPAQKTAAKPAKAVKTTVAAKTSKRKTAR